ncbi:MAG: VWA domain-containing protein [Lysobacteraceae bacterium]|nr:MAG: VWA domain-containing protein [Xanthomonadaceae bacterium]
MQRQKLAVALLCALGLAACSTSPSDQVAASGAVAEADAPAAPPAPAAGYATTLDTVTGASPQMSKQANLAARMQAPMADAFAGGYRQDENTEHYEHREDNPVLRTSEQPVSTFSIDVDTGSYANVRRMLRQGVRPPADAVRAEEFINYFNYGHPAPASRETPFRVSTALAPAPWNAKRQLLMIGIKGYDVPKATLPPANLVFLIDTSGSMDQPNKLPLLKQAFAQLVPQLRAQDRVSIVVYAGSAGLVLPPTPGDRQGEILAALEQLQAGGSTNGGEGIQLAYAMAKQSFAKGGVNRVILATDGDFNVGTSNRKTLETLVGDQRKSGIALSTLGFGDGNYNDAMAERLADVGDGNHAYIDTLQEARKVLVEEMQSTLLTIARDVKIQVEFNPAQVAEYRLIGYENRALKNEDFANDKVDAGDIGAGHEVTALYEITPVGSGAERLPPLRYAGKKVVAAETATSGEIAHLRLRYKLPEASASKLIETAILRTQLQAEPGESLRFAAAVAAFADALRGGTQMEGWSWDDIAAAARTAQGTDRWGLRAEFLQLVAAARLRLGAASTQSTSTAD